VRARMYTGVKRFVSESATATMAVDDGPTAMGAQTYLTPIYGL